MKLDKVQRAELAALQSQLKVVAHDVTATVGEMRGQLDFAVSRANKSIDRYNLVAKKARAFALKVAEDLRDEYDEKSEKWKEGDAGQAAESMVSAWEEDDVDELPLIVLLQPDGPDAANTFDTLPEESE